MRTKQIFCLIVGLSVLASWGNSQSLAFRLSGGLSYADCGDLARGINGEAQYLASEFNTSGKYKVPTLGPSVSGEILLSLGPRLGIGLGVGYFWHEAESAISYSFGGLDVSQSVKPKFNVVPITANIHWLLALGERVSLDLSLGAGYYLTFFRWENRMDIDILGFGGYFDYTFKSAKGAVGLQGGVGLEIKISPRLALVWAVLGRYAVLSDWNGDWTDTGGGDLWSYGDSGSDHKAWYYELSSGGKTYPQILFDLDKPTGANYSNVRAAKLSLTGLTATLGIKMGF